MFGARLYNWLYDFSIEIVIVKTLAGIPDTKMTSYNVFLCFIWDYRDIKYEQRAMEYTLYAHIWTIIALIIRYFIEFIFNLGSEVERNFVTVVLLILWTRVCTKIIIWTIVWVYHHQREIYRESK